MSPSSLDYSYFDAKKAVEAADGNPGYYKTLTWQGRMVVANYLNSIKYNYTENDPPRMDKTCFRASRMDDEDQFEN
ncbi:MAG TPA: hypothetical protein VFE54_14995 [Mucilaginibacter sp.]|jgi:hypothetical protein|nr:hypothetical protein [Mucilaginibacter sp.]